MGGVRWAPHRSIVFRPHTVAYLAPLYGVSEAHFLKVVLARKRFRAAKRDRARKAGKTVASYRNIRSPKLLRAGEGELHGWLRRLGMTGEEFCKIVGITHQTFSHWSGFSMWPWPTRYLALYAYARNMERFLASKGFELDQFRDSPITEMFHQHYRINDPKKLVLEGVTEEERAKRRRESGIKAAEARWGKKDPGYTPWKL